LGNRPRLVRGIGWRWGGKSDGGAPNEKAKMVA